MEQILLQRPRELVIGKPARMALIGGFLGAGKTTAIIALAKCFQARGLKSAIVTNDQAPDLVDTAIVRASGQSVAEVVGGCFCCKFPDMLDAMEKVAQCEPDVLLCEPVGSCADIAATVLNPLRFFYKDQLRLAPLSVLVDPLRVREIVVQDAKTHFPTEVTYIFDQQLREADIIVLTKIDTLDPSEKKRLLTTLQDTYGKQVIGVSSQNGTGMDEWVEILVGDSAAGSNVLKELDYTTYAAGEAALGWLNATIEIKSDAGFNADRLFCSVMDGIRNACSQRNAEIAHLKATLTGNGNMTQSNLTTTHGQALYNGDKIGMTISATLAVNARVHMDPGTLGGIVANAVQSAAIQSGANAIIKTLQSFSPPYPRPPFQIRDELTNS